MYDKRKIVIDMTLEEMAELYQRGLIPKENYFPPKGEFYCEQFNFINQFHFTPFSLSELAQSIEISQYTPQRYTSGRIYLARKKGDKIQLIHPFSIHEKAWREKKLGREESIMYGWTAGERLEKEYSWKDGPLYYQIFGKEDYLDLEKVAEDVTAKVFGKKFEIGAKPSLSEVCSLPIWQNTQDYEQFIRAVYGNEDINKGLKDGYPFYVINPTIDIGNSWMLLTSCISSHKTCRSVFYLFDKAKPDMMLRMNAVVPSETRGLESFLLMEFAKPQGIGNGVIVMNEDRVPKYLQRILGLGGKK